MCHCHLAQGPGKAGTNNTNFLHILLAIKILNKTYDVKRIQDYARWALKKKYMWPMCTSFRNDPCLASSLIANNKLNSYTGTHVHVFVFICLKDDTVLVRFKNLLRGRRMLLFINQEHISLKFCPYRGHTIGPGAIP